MPAANQFILYGTSACHLCEQALEALSSLKYDIELTMTDVSENDLLLERYGLRIPVLRHSMSGNELNWPFGPDELCRFLDSCRQT
ncbi:MAG TPA: glutaredoxin family protein [Methylophilaceae bacterium]|jgi:hypothetical protein